MIVAVLGLGEAGSRISADLAREGVEVRGYDPADVVTPAGVIRQRTAGQAVRGAEMVLAITAAADAATALAQVADGLESGVLYADLSTASPSLKMQLAASAAACGALFVDVALMATVPGRGLRTPALASGPGAERYITTMSPYGISLEAISTTPGDAATRKLLRSVFMKGLAAVVIEAMSAAEAAGQSAWLWRNLVDEVTAAGAPLLSRLVGGTSIHAERRLHEMEASAQLLADLGVDASMTRAVVASLQLVIRDGMPAIPVVDDEATT